MPTIGKSLRLMAGYAALGILRGAARAVESGMKASAAAEPHYDYTGNSKRSQSWAPSNPSIGALLFGSGARLRSQSRDLIRRNGWARNGKRSFVGNAIGLGIKPRSVAKDEKFREAAMALWLRWTDEADADGTLDYYGLQALVAGAVFEAGECFVRFRTRRIEDGLSVPFQLQVLESEMLPLEKNEVLPSGNEIRAGIEFNQIGKRVAYHFWKRHPGDNHFFPFGAFETVRVPASEVLHVYEVTRPGQIRGEPKTAAALATLRELEQYEDAELLRKKLQNFFMAFVTRINKDANVLNEPVTPDGKIDHTGGQSSVAMVPGVVQYLDQNEDMKFSEPPHATPGEIDFLKQKLHLVAAAMGTTYENLTGDLAGVTFSSIRAGLIEFRRVLEQFQHFVIAFQFCRPVWIRWMDLAVLSDALEAKGYEENPYDFQQVEWIAPKWSYVNPIDDVKADVIATRAGFKSRARVQSEAGEDPEQLDREIDRCNKRADQLELVFDSDARRTSAAGVGQIVGGGQSQRDPETGEETPRERSAA
ncbi:MAG: phage portal protein [Bdellovibrionota bacterium]